jgi:uncharacterized repeat protein (TIGR03803 family)
VTCPDGRYPTGLIQASDGSLYGTTLHGGTSTACATVSPGCGTIFTITENGTLEALHNFEKTDGDAPEAVVQGMDGSFYGTTSEGGANQSCLTYYEEDGCGTIFKITPGGTLTTLYNFCDQGYPCPDGAVSSAGLIQGTDGAFHGTTAYGGAYGAGTVFKMTPGGTLTTLYSFCSQKRCPDGEVPITELVQGTGGDFYGTTFYGGTKNNNGTIFKITPGGKLTTLYIFCDMQPSCPDGSNPGAPLIQATDGNFYGTTFGGGNKENGTVFSITPSGTLTTLHAFSGSDGNNPATPLVQDTSGEFYGTTEYGGPVAGFGTIFSLSVGLGPFVKPEPTVGKVGAAVKILGTNLTGATSVSFNGTAAEFTVDSSSLIKTTVPAGATTGTVQVLTPSYTLSNNVPFLVRP